MVIFFAVIIFTRAPSSKAVLHMLYTYLSKIINVIFLWQVT